MKTRVIELRPGICVAISPAEESKRELPAGTFMIQTTNGKCLILDNEGRGYDTPQLALSAMLPRLFPYRDTTVDDWRKVARLYLETN